MYFAACSTYGSNYYTITMLCYAMLCYAMLCYAMLCYAMLCYAMLCYAMLCYAMLCYAMLCYIAMQLLQHFHSAYIIENTSSEAQQPKSVSVILNGDRRESSLERGIAENVMGEIPFQRFVVCIFTEIGYLFFRK